MNLSKITLLNAFDSIAIDPMLKLFASKSTFSYFSISSKCLILLCYVASEDSRLRIGIWQFEDFSQRHQNSPFPWSSPPSSSSPFDEIQFVLTSIMNVPLPASLFVCSLSSPSCLEFFKILKHLSSCQLIGFADQFSGTPALSRNPPTADAIVSLLFSSDFSIKNHLCIVQWREERMNLFLLKLEWSQSSKSIITLTGTEFCKD